MGAGEFLNMSHSAVAGQELLGGGTPRCGPNSWSSSRFQDQAQTLKNLSSCSSRASFPSAERMEVNDPCVS
jgi:hypothetical protein